MIKFRFIEQFKFWFTPHIPPPGEGVSAKLTGVVRRNLKCRICLIMRNKSEIIARIPHPTSRSLGHLEVNCPQGNAVDCHASVITGSQ